MRFGVCCEYSKIEAVKKAGYDYFEPAFRNLINMSESEFEAVKADVEKHSLHAEAFNCFFPGDMKLYEQTDEQIKEYCEKGFGRASKIGGKVAVIGSGPARSVPDGMDKTKALTRFAEILRICGDIAQKYGMIVVIEPLRAQETNIINTVAEGLELAKRCNHPAVKCLADFFHVYLSGEGLETIKKHGGELGHVHLARPNEDRKIPDIDDLDDCKVLADALKSSGYNQRISLEGTFLPDLETAIYTAKPILELFK